MTDRIAVAPGLTFTRAADEGIVLDEAGGQVHILNGAAARVWEMLETGAGLEEIVARLADGTSASPARVRADVLAVLAEMAELGLVLDPPPAA